MIAHTIRAARRSQLLDSFVVSTDDPAIGGVAAEEGAEVLSRPRHLATDRTATGSVLEHAWVNALVNQRRADIVVTLQPTSPLRSAEVIDTCIRELIKTGADSVVTMCEAAQPPEWMYRLGDDGRAHPLLNRELPTRRQDHQQAYVLNGAVYVTRSHLVRDRRVFGGDMRVVLMDRYQSLDIDEPYDLLVGEMILAGQRRNRQCG